MQPSKKQYWHDLPTIQSKEILAELIDCKENRRAALIINKTGMGKTNSVKLFQKTKPLNTFIVTVGDSYKLEDVVDELAGKIGLQFKRHTHYRRVMSIRQKLEEIAKNLIQLEEDGGNPMIIIDEAENLKPSVLKTIKELYDAVIESCSIVMIGTEQIMDSILNLRNKNRTSVPQLWRRFKAGTRHVTSFNKARDMKPFFDKYIPKEDGIHALLIENCENYGELHDYLEPVLRYADKRNEPVTEKLFRLYHKMPALKN